MIRLNFSIYHKHIFSYENDLVICIFLSIFPAINKTVEELQSEGISCKGYVVDISKRENVFEAAKQLKEEFGGVDILINNAGIVCCKPLWDLPEKVIENTYNVNILSHYWVMIILLCKQSVLKQFFFFI